jgi:hypothetical protein
MTFFRSCFSFVFVFVFACFCLCLLSGGEQGKWDVSLAGTFKTGGQDLSLYICNDRKDGRMQYEETNKKCRFIFSQQWPLTGTFVCAQAVGNTNEWSIGHGRKAAVLNVKKTKKKKKTNGLPTRPADDAYPTKGMLYR